AARRGISDSRGGQGNFIRLSTWELLVAAIDVMMLLNAVNIRELFEVRKALEVELAGLAAERATDDDLSHINAVLRKQEISLANPQAFLEGDLDSYPVDLCRTTLTSFMPLAPTRRSVE